MDFSIQYDKKNQSKEPIFPKVNLLLTFYSFFL